MLAYSPTFLAKMAPKINPKPQLKRETSNVKNVIIAAEFAVLVQYLVPFEIILLIGLLNASVCPSTSINIICTENTRRGECQIPRSQNDKICKK